MGHLNRDELVRLFKVARQHNPLHHVALLVGLLHGLRVSETLAIRGRDICDGRVSVKRLKKSRPTLHALRIDSDPLFDESPLWNSLRLTLRPNCFRGHASTWTLSLNGMLPSRAFIPQSGTTMF